MPVEPTAHARLTAPWTTLAVPLILSDTTRLQQPLPLFLTLLPPLPPRAPTPSSPMYLVLPVAARASRWQLPLLKFQECMDWRLCLEACLLVLPCCNVYIHGKGTMRFEQAIDCSCGIAHNICLVACLLERASEHLNSVMRTWGKSVMGITT